MVASPILRSSRIELDEGEIRFSSVYVYVQELYLECRAPRYRPGLDSTPSHWTSFLLRPVDGDIQ